MIDLRNGDCLEVLKDIPDNSVDSIVTDPPYGINFMGKKWDYDVPTVDVWRECLRVLKPGGHLLSFAGTKTQHRMCINIEDAGFEIRDMIAWVYGSGFPKSQNISKMIDKKVGINRELTGEGTRETFNSVQEGSNSLNNRCKKCGKPFFSANACKCPKPKPVTDEAKQWDGWGTALKPALEPITMARKPLSEKTVVNNVLEHGTGGINIDDSRVNVSETDPNHRNTKESDNAGNNENVYKTSVGGVNYGQNPQGRFPANLIHDGSDEVEECFPYTKSGAIKEGTYLTKRKTGQNAFGEFGYYNNEERLTNEGSASRFFYCAKASKKDREENNNHPTVKPTELMRYLVRMVTPEGGTVLDPFMGSGSTGKASVLEDFNFIGIEREKEYIEIAKSRIYNIKINKRKDISDVFE